MTTKIETELPSVFESICMEVFRNQKENEEVQLLILRSEMEQQSDYKDPCCRKNLSELKGSHKLMRQPFQFSHSFGQWLFAFFKITEWTLPQCNNFTCTGIYHITYPFNRTITFKLPFYPLLRRLVVLQQSQRQWAWCYKITCHLISWVWTKECDSDLRQNYLQV